MACICCGPTGCNGGRIPREVSVSFTLGDELYSNYPEGECPTNGFRSMIDGTKVCNLISYTGLIAYYSSQTPSSGINLDISWACNGLNFFGLKTAVLSWTRCGTPDETCYRYTNFQIATRASNWLYPMPNLLGLTPGSSQSFSLSVTDNSVTGSLGYSDIFVNCGERPLYTKAFKAEIVVQPIW